MIASVLNKAYDSESSKPSFSKLQLSESDCPVLVFGGPYSNLQATEALMAESRRLGVAADRVICTGDIVAYCAQPSETTQLIREWGISVVMGNCEESLVNSAMDCGCGFEENSSCSLLSVTWYRFADQAINLEQRQWMSTLPELICFALAGKQIAVIHGSAESINQFIFPSTPGQEKIKQFELIKTLTGVYPDIIIGGHCGIPFANQLTLADNRQVFWLNAGVIGMPANDGTSDGWYMLLEPDSEQNQLKVSFNRLAYDTDTAQRTMSDRGLNTPYQSALSSGLWPSTDILPEKETADTGKPLQLAPVFIY